MLCSMLLLARCWLLARCISSFCLLSACVPCSVSVSLTFVAVGACVAVRAATSCACRLAEPQVCCYPRIGRRTHTQHRLARQPRQAAASRTRTRYTNPATIQRAACSTPRGAARMPPATLLASCGAKRCCSTVAAANHRQLPSAGHRLCIRGSCRTKRQLLICRVVSR